MTKLDNELERLLGLDDEVKRLARFFVVEHLSPDALDSSTFYEDDAVIDLMSEYDDEDLWIRVEEATAAALDTLAQRYLDEEN